MFILNRAKRKNDAPRTRRRWIIALLTVGLIGALTLPFLFPGGCVLPTHNIRQPFGYLYYRTDETTYSLNLQTWESVGVRSQPADSIGHAFAVVSPNDRWRVTWKINLAKKHEGLLYDLILEDNQTLKEVRSLGPFEATATTLIWSPDSEWLALDIPLVPTEAEPSATGSSLWMIHRETGRLTLLATAATQASNPRFSPTSDKLAYVIGGILWVLDLGPTANVGRPIFLNTPVLQFIWSPDGEWFAYVPITPEQPVDIWAVRVDGTQAQELVSNGGVNWVVDWRP